MRFAVILGAAAAGAVPALCAAPSIRVEPAVLDFGERGHDERATLPLLVRNAGDEVLQLGEIYSSCDCTKWSFARGSKTIPPGGDAELRIRLSTGPVLGTLDKYVRISSNDTTHPEVRVPVRASVHANVEMTPRFLEAFNGSKEGDPVTQTVTLTYREPRGERMKLEKIQTSAPHFAAKAEPLEEDRNGFRVHVSLLPTAPEGKVSGNVEAVLDGRKFIIRVHGEMFRGIRILPNFINFNRIEDPGRAHVRFRLESTDGFPFEILEIRSDPAWLAFQVRPEDTYLAHDVTARIATSEKPDRFYGKIRIQTSHPEKPLLEVPFSGFFPSPRPPATPAPKPVRKVPPVPAPPPSPPRRG
ncbi:MAG: DUF1573 domain-containing protein [Planctomycetes bacterium]|nr:DUF1573 domain-containing protein [Planctomycetota bacterium]